MQAVRGTLEHLRWHLLEGVEVEAAQIPKTLLLGKAAEVHSIPRIYLRQQAVEELGI